VGTAAGGSDAYQPTAVAYDSAKGEIFVDEPHPYGQIDGAVTVISTATDKILANIQVGSYSWVLAYAPQLGEMFAMDTNSGGVNVINDTTDLVVASMALPYNYPQGLVYDRATGELYVSNSGNDPVLVISLVSGTIVATVKVGDSAAGPVYDPALGEIFTANGYSNTVSVISDGTG
jgi:DNA-binding beta-propeller fold protein YncE